MRELVGYQIVIEQAQARAGLAEVDRAFEKVDASATKAGSAIDRAMREASAASTKLSRDVVAMGPQLNAMGELSVAALRKTEQAAKGAAGATGEASRQVGVMQSSLGSLGRYVLGAFAIERVVSFGTQIVTTAGQVKDLSDQSGIGTRALQAMGYAAGQSGSNIQAVASAVAEMSRNLLSGNAGAVGALRQLGLSHQALIAMKPEQAFLDIADAVKAIKDPMVQADTWSRIFGKGALELLPAVKAGFSETAAEAERLGLIISDRDITALDNMGDAWDRVALRAKAATAGMLSDVMRIGTGISEAIGRMLTPGPIGQQMAANVPSWVPSLGQQALLGPLAFIPSGLNAAANYFDPKTLAPMAPVSSHGSSLSLRPMASHGTDDQAAASRVRLARATESAESALAKLTASTVAYLRTVMPAIGLGATVSQLERTAAYRGLLSSAGSTYLQTGIAGAFQVDPYGSTLPGGGSIIMPSTNPYSMMGGLQQNVTGQRGLSSALAARSGDGSSWWDGRGGKAVGAGIGVAGGAAMGALTGGDQYASMVGAGASAVGYAALAGGTMSAAALGAATMGIGAAAVGVYMLVKHFASVSKEVKQAREEVLSFQQSLWATMTAQQVTEAGGEQWAATVIVVRDAYERMGYSALQAESEVAKLFDTSNPDQARAAMARINNIMSDYRAILAGVNEQMGDLLGQSLELGQRLPQGLLDALDAAVRLGDMTEENARLIAQLTQAPEVDYRKYEEAAARYGINPDALGQGYQQNKTTTTAQQMVDDVDLLTRGGASMGTILHGMREEISALVNQSLEFGTTLPANMKPWIEELFRTKQLVDENGEALTDITHLKFGEDLQTTFQRVADSIQALIDMLKGPLSSALDTIGNKVVKPRVEVDVTTPPDRQTESNGDGTYFRNGGVVYAAMGWPFVPKGTDTVPAMLTPGEGVLSRRGMAMLGTLNAGASSGGGAGMDYDRLAAAVTRAMQAAGVGALNVDGRELSGALVPHIGPELEFQGAWR